MYFRDRTKKKRIYRWFSYVCCWINGKLLKIRFIQCPVANDVPINCMMVFQWSFPMKKYHVLRQTREIHNFRRTGSTNIRSLRHNIRSISYMFPCQSLNVYFILCERLWKLIWLTFWVSSSTKHFIPPIGKQFA